MAIEGVILDVDGTLVASNDAHAQAWVDAFRAYGYDIQFEQVRPLIGMGGDQIIPRLAPGLTSEEGVGKQITDHRKQLILDRIGMGLTSTNGARELVEKMQQDGLRLIVATSASEQEMNLLLKIAQVDDLIPQFTTSSEVEDSKPEPDLVEAALSKANLQSDRTVMLGDTPYDIESAAKAGVDVIALRSGGFDDQQLQGAIAIYDDPSDLLRHYETSPLATIAATNNIDHAESVMVEETTKSTTNSSWQSTQAKASQLFTNASTYTNQLFSNNRRLLTTLGWTVLALFGVRLLFGALDAFDDIPLVSPLLKLVGFVYVVRFAWHYLIRVEGRQELKQRLNRTKTEILGSSVE